MYIIVANYIDIRNQDFSPHYNSTAGTAQRGSQISDWPKCISFCVGENSKLPVSLLGRFPGDQNPITGLWWRSSGIFCRASG